MLILYKTSVVIKAVITGDIIHSSRIRTEHKVLLYDSISDALRTWDKDFKMKSEFYRGDSFQCLVHSVKDALRVALIIKAYIRSLTPSEKHTTVKGKQIPVIRSQSGFFHSAFIFDARITIGIGTTNSEKRRLGTSDGEAFQLSGRELDEIKLTKRSISVVTNDKYADELRTESIMLNAVLDKTTALQCEVIYLKLLGYTEIEMEKLLKVNQSAINQRANSANWFAIETFVKRFESVYSI